jgi:uncharacterized membrane protein YeaQ/YmgE (transglycosylase-associated protein family)
MVITTSLIVGWIITGLVIGGLARLLVPGRQHIGVLMTLLIGIVGAILVSLIVTALLVSAVASNGYRHYRGSYSRRSGGRWLRW